MLFGGIGGLRGGNLQPLMMGIRNYLLQKENPQIDNFLENLSQQIENFPNQNGGEMIEPDVQPRPYYGPNSMLREQPYMPEEVRTSVPRNFDSLQMNTGLSLEKGLDFLYGK